MSDPTATELLSRAARLYREAGQDLDACRCLERLGDFAGAGWLHEQERRLPQAAACFERAGLWLAAAQAHEAAGAFADAARCYEAYSWPLEAAWILAHHTGRRERALALVAGLTESSSLNQTLMLALVRARCRAAAQPADAAAAVRRVIAAFAAGTLTGDLSAGLSLRVLFARALALAEVLNRPDLIAALFATVPDTTAAWAAWATRRLGSADGVPVTDLAGSTWTEGSAA